MNTLVRDAVALTPPLPVRTIRSYQFGGHDMNLETDEAVFQPTLTSRVLARQVQIPAQSSVLDLGCGVGVLAVVAALRGAARVDAVDVMEQARPLVEANARLNGVGECVHAFSGDLFAPIGTRRYDVIISDVSGVVDELSRMSPWYPTTIPTGGYDGANQIVRMLEEAGDHLSPGGSLYFPTGSISNVPRTLEAAHGTFGDKVELLEDVEVPFVAEFKDNMATMSRLRDEGLINYTTRRSRHLWTLQIYRCWV